MSFADLMDRELPVYARPVFLRIQKGMVTTATFKLVKRELREQGYHLDQIGEDEILIQRPRSSKFEPLDETLYAEIMAGKGGF